MAPRHVFATAHGAACYLKWQKGFGRLVKVHLASSIAAARAPLLPWRHNSGALETVKASNHLFTSGSVHRMA